LKDLQLTSASMSELGAKVKKINKTRCLNEQTKQKEPAFL